MGHLTKALHFLEEETHLRAPHRLRGEARRTGLPQREAEGSKGRTLELVPSNSGARSLPRLETLARAQPVWAGPGQATRLGALRTKQGQANTRGAGSPLQPSSPRVLGCWLVCPHHPPRRLSSPQSTQRRRASAVGVLYCVLSPRSQPRARWLVTSQASQCARSSGFLGATRRCPVGWDD